MAWDPAANKERWRVSDLGGLGRGGTIVTAGNIVFHGSMAYNAETGDKLWSVDLGGTYCNPSTHELDGKQYVAILARTNPRTLCSSSRSAARRLFPSYRGGLTITE